MIINSGFPRELLKKTYSERLEYFHSYTVAHPKLTKALESINSTIQNSASGTLIFIYGPTGVGKTTLRLKVERELIQSVLKTLDKDRGMVPIIGLPAIASESGSFNWKDFFRRLLLAMNEPCIDNKKIILKDENTPSQVNLLTKAGCAELRYAAEQILRLRRPKALLIDDAQHMAKMHSGKKLQDQLDCIKSIADIIGLPIGLFGTYELLAFRNLSAQLSRRSVDIHISRYQIANNEDEHVFKSVLWAFQRHLPLEQEPDLLAEWDYFYERSIGCIGVLKDWLFRSLGRALKDGGIKLNKEIYKDNPLSISQCEKMLSEAIEGELKLTETKASYIRLRTKLGLETIGDKISSIPNLSIAENNTDNLIVDNPLKKTKQKKNSFKQRRIQRDPIGNG